jgi:hypothetical protein
MVCWFASPLGDVLGTVGSATSCVLTSASSAGVIAGGPLACSADVVPACVDAPRAPDPPAARTAGVIEAAMDCTELGFGVAEPLGSSVPALPAAGPAIAPLVGSATAPLPDPATAPLLEPTTAPLPDPATASLAVAVTTAPREELAAWLLEPAGLASDVAVPSEGPAVRGELAAWAPEGEGAGIAREDSSEVDVDACAPTGDAGVEAGPTDDAIAGPHEPVTAVEARPNVEATLDIETALEEATLDIEAALDAPLRSVEVELEIGASSELDAGEGVGATLDVEAGGDVDWEVSSLEGSD